MGGRRTAFTGLLCAVALLGLHTPTNGSTVVQTAQFDGATPKLLYDIFMDASQHAAACAHGPIVLDPRVGGTLRAFRLPPEACAAWRGCAPNGEPTYLVEATILKLVPEREIVMSWRNLGWKQAVDPDDVTDLESIVTLTFSKNTDGAQIELVQVNVPDYAVKLPDSRGPLSALVNTHWNTVYWGPWHQYVAARLGRANPRRATEDH